MPEWEEWQPSPSGGESPDFPRLQELILRECPKLIGDLPTHLPSLKTLDVSECEVLHENRASNTLNMESLRGSLEKLTITCTKTCLRDGNLRTQNFGANPSQLCVTQVHLRRAKQLCVT
ncbi:hypothetical protein C1H46_024303 [Malus baccata]|uniref:Uncharacterized protein n=1 Tax=Malus baccata TaxID=106549 RepID=A0A540LUY3_MALBA|nr:hypothetical protein C1H46_024303 [Malus baccata]